MPPSITDLLTTMDYGPSPESAQPALDWLAGHGRRFGHFIGGTWVAGAGHFDSVNPADGQVLAQVAQAGAAEVQAAVAAAEAAQAGWAALGSHGRARHLYALARALQRHARLFAVLETLDNGKTIRETRDVDVPLAARHFYHHAGWAQLLDREFPRHRALGVVGQIVPWNFPLLMLAWKIAPALACGNTVVFKPAEQTSLTALRFAELCTEVGLPPGVVSIVTGDGETGRAIVDHARIAKIAFTGSTEVGRAIRRATAGSGKRLSLELGGKSPFIVFADADLDAACEGLVDSIFFNQGQVCCAGSRLLVQEGVAPRLLAKLERRMAQIRVGHPLDKSTDMGHLVDRTQWQRVAGFVDRAREQGARIVQPGAAVLAEASAGCAYPPTLVCDVDGSFEIVRDEVFGPVLTAQTFRTPAEAVDLANNTAYGLAACVWSESIGLALDVAPRLQAGVVWVNAANLFDAACGFGGYRESGFGREGGREGLREYLRAVDDAPVVPTASGPARAAGPAGHTIDRTPKLYIGGQQARPDGGATRVLRDDGGQPIGSVPVGNRKDIRNAVEAARAAQGWARQTAHGRAQVLYYLAENLDAQRARLVQVLGQTLGEAAADAEVDRAIGHLFDAAAWADKHDGAVHQPPLHGVVLALHEPMGIVGIVAPDDAPLSGLVALAAPAMAMGNRVVVVPSRVHPLVSAELSVLADTSDLPGGVLNLVTGDADALGDTLAAHAEVAAFWAPGATAVQAQRFEQLSAGNLKRTWVGAGWPGAREMLYLATQVKNVWVPYGT
ncbi:aldehyde dehydrogenase family protein [Ideonella sp. A 288]|uniref:aldehyde dehydrogenase family protein n=1 Tax=Ideonella sp. A 288 TaxID=1962181 RepID=UPI001F485644|nr:aldehyde dehydrogenase family protein [Ideonella sp. A 288]